MHGFVRLSITLLVTVVLTGVPQVSSADAGSVYLPGFPTLKQQHSLTCEASATSMATRGQVTEGQIMAALPRSPNPNLGFRGNPSGLQGTRLIDYGVYAAPVHRALQRFNYHSEVMMYANDRVIMSYINRGWPVVVWVTYNLQPAQPRFGVWKGSQFFLVPHEHAVLVVGYDGQQIVVNDPWTRTRKAYPWWAFNRSWGLFANMGLAVEPCPLPQPVTGLTVATLSPSGITWTWTASARTDHYQVMVTRHSKHDRVVFQGTTTGTQYTFATPDPGYTYEISVQSVSICGGTSAAANLAAAIPAPSPTPSEGQVGTPSSVGTPSPTAVATTTVPITPTPSATPGH